MIKFLNRFSYYPPKFEMLSVQIETWAAAPNMETDGFGALYRGPRYQMHLALPNRIALETLPPQAAFNTDETPVGSGSKRFIHFGSEKLISDGSRQYEMHWLGGDEFDDAAAPFITDLRSHSALLDHVDPTVVLRARERPFRREEHPLLSSHGRFVYCRFGKYCGMPVRQRLSIDHKTGLPLVFSIATTRDDIEIARTAFSDWVLTSEVNADVFRLPHVREKVDAVRFGQIMDRVFGLIAESFEIPGRGISRYYKVGEGAGEIDRSNDANNLSRRLTAFATSLRLDLAKFGDPTQQQLQQQDAFFSELMAGVLTAGEIMRWMSEYEAICDASPK